MSKDPPAPPPPLEGPISPQAVEDEPILLVELRDSSGTIQNRIEADIESLQWSYQRIGGCGDFTAIVAKPFGELSGIEPGWDICIHKKRPGVASYDLYYRGLVQQTNQQLAEPDKTEINGIGYREQLNRILITATYSVTDVSSIVSDIMTNQVVPATDISIGSIATSSVTVQTIAFTNTTAFNAIGRLADIAGTREWGVDRNRNFFFVTRETSLAISLFPGGNLARYDQRDRFDVIKNNVTVEGAQVGGVTITVTRADSASQVQHGRRDLTLQAGNIQNSVDAQTLADAILAEEAGIRQEAIVSTVGWPTLVESKAPVGTISVREGEVLWGTKNWGEFRWGGVRKYQLNDARYTLTDQGVALEMTLEVGKPSLSLPIRQLRADLDAVRQRTL